MGVVSSLLGSLVDLYIASVLIRGRIPYVTIVGYIIIAHVHKIHVDDAILHTRLYLFFLST